MAVAVPNGDVTVMSTRPVACAGVVAVIEVAVALIFAAAVPPKLRLAVSARPEPVMVTLVPPCKEPNFGETPLMVGGEPYVTMRFTTLALWIV